MKRYIKNEDDRYQYMVLQTLNGYSVEVLVVSTGDMAGLTKQVAQQLHVTLPPDYRIQGRTREIAEAELDRVANLNGWTEMEEKP